MTQPKSFASLGPTLLARKGAARPAMRPQVQPMANPQQPAEANLEDLGWNDMGEEMPHAGEADIVELTPARANPETTAESIQDDREARAQLAAARADKPVVRRQQEEIEEKLAAAVAPPEAATQAEPARAEPAQTEPAQAEPAQAPPHTPKAKAKVSRARKSALDRGARAAFTLRLDSQRHLKLRLASTIRNRSAQQIVTEALDRLLDEIPEIDSLAAQVKRR